MINNNIRTKRITPLEEAAIHASDNMIQLAILAIGGLFSLLFWYFKRTQTATDKRLDNHDDDIEQVRHDLGGKATRPELERLRDSTEAKHTELERDVKNLGERLSIVVRSEVDTLRIEQQAQHRSMNERLDQQHRSMNERLDKLLVIFAGGQNK